LERREGITLIGGQTEYSGAVGEGASLKIVDIVNSGESNFERRLTLAAGSRLRVVCIISGSAGINYSVELQGEGTEAEIYSLYRIGGIEEAAVSVTVKHNVPYCRSYLLAKGIAEERSKGSFNALTYVATDAQRTVAEQLIRSLQLSPDAQITATPQLEIYADDVKCSHGATVGQLDQEQIYYMRQRGISEQEACRLQIAGFVNEIVSKIGDEELERSIHESTGLQYEI